MPDEHMKFTNASLGIDIIYPYSIIKTSDNELTANNISTVHWDLVSPHLILVPKQDQLILVSSQQHWVQH